MTRRSVVRCSSDEQESSPPATISPPPPSQQGYIDDVIIEDIEVDFQTVNINSSNPTPDTNNSSSTTSAGVNIRFTSEPIPLDISDDDEDIANDDSVNYSNYRSIHDDNRSGSGNYFDVSDSPVNGVLEGLGLRLRKECLDSCLVALQSSVRGFHGMDDSSKAKLCFQQFLFSDMNYCGAGVLPPNVHTLHLVDLKGPFVLQVDEIVNISCPLRARYQNAGPGSKRCLKLSMTDGVQRVFGMEYRPIKDLEVLSPAGLKIVILNVHTRHGLLMLVPEVLEVFGGSVQELEAARQRLVSEIIKPPRGKRNRTEVVPPLAARATLAAWPQHDTIVPGRADRTIRENTESLPGRGQETAPGTFAANQHSQASAVPGSRNITDPRTSSGQQRHEHVNVVQNHEVPASTPSQTAMIGTTFRIPSNFEVPMSGNINSNSSPSVQPQKCVTVSQNIDYTARTHFEDVGQVAPFTPMNNMPREGAGLSISTNNAMSAAQPEEHVTIPLKFCRTSTQDTTHVQTAGEDTYADGMPAGDATVPFSVDSTGFSRTFDASIDVEEISMVNDLVNPLVFSRDQEIPFTYLASLSAKCAAVEDNSYLVRGKIKCFLTGVKGFQYKKRTTYELRVYVDDGSLISEVLIDNSVVQSGIGFSPQEVTNALASSDANRVTEMKEILKTFQILLVNFEGTMVVEMSKSSPVPIAVEMNQGCTSSNARLLLKRLKPSSSTPQNHGDPIDVSP